MHPPPVNPIDKSTTTEQETQTAVLTTITTPIATNSTEHDNITTIDAATTEDQSVNKANEE